MAESRTRNFKLGLAIFPEICQECVSLRLAKEESLKYFYEDVTIYVRKVLSGDTTNAIVEQENGEKDKDSSFEVTVCKVAAFSFDVYLTQLSVPLQRAKI